MSQKKVIQIRIEEEEKNLWQSFVENSAEFSTVSKLIKQSIGKFVRGKFTELNKEEWEIVKGNMNKRSKEEMLLFYSGGKCSRCGYDKSLSVLGLYHKDKTKQFTLFKIEDIQDYSWEEIKEEMKKYIPLCRSCLRTLYDLKLF